jgi:sulfur carrier protein ThiS
MAFSEEVDQVKANIQKIHPQVKFDTGPHVVYLNFSFVPKVTP